MRAAISPLLAAAVACAGCDGENLVAGNAWSGAGQASVSTATPVAPAQPAPAALRVEFTETDFAEGDRSRDPFRSYAASNASNARAVVNQRNVLMAEYALEEMRLMAIVQGGDQVMAMLVDPKGKGTTVRRGDFVGRPEYARTGGVGSTEYQVNWRVDRIRSDDVVLVREDPAQPTSAPLSRVLTIHPGGGDPSASPK